MVKLISDPNYVTESEVYFYTPRFYAFDNFSAFSVSLWGHNFMTAEHAYQWKKYSFIRPDLAEKILCATSAYQTKKISDANKDVVPNDWAEHKLQVMEEILHAKITQHEKIKELLKETGSKTIIENSPTDLYWGFADGDGQNQLGVLWMKLRDELNEENS